jgi:predicted ATP-dependent endonuclease of OLD family
MRILELEITKFRGIKHIELRPNGSNLVIVGHNGTGKSGVVDALDFLLTGKNIAINGGRNPRYFFKKSWQAH